MPHYHRFEWEGWVISAKPIGIRRWKMFGWVPYRTGNKPAFKVSIKGELGEQQSLKATINLKRSNVSKNIQQWSFPSKPNMPFSNVEEDISIYPIATGSDHCLEINLALSSTSHSTRARYDLVSFRPIVQESITMLVVGGLLALVGAVVGGLLVHYLAGGNPTP